MRDELATFAVEVSAQRPLARASGPGRAGRPRRRLVFCIYLVYILIDFIIFVCICIYFDIFLYIFGSFCVFSVYCLYIVSKFLVYCILLGALVDLA